jgi:EAL domain-containing protein (putative c-di-GMP-specific phosphodiesterase class I)
MLSAIGVDYGQGFHIGEPRPISDIPAPTGAGESADLARAGAGLERLPA